jgi:hypothetical protein
VSIPNTEHRRENIASAWRMRTVEENPWSPSPNTALIVGNENNSPSGFKRLCLPEARCLLAQPKAATRGV